MGLVTSIDSDHLDIYGNFGEVKKSFGQFIKKIASKVVVSKDNQELANSFLEDLDNNDDVQNIYTNLNLVNN